MINVNELKNGLLRVAQEAEIEGDLIGFLI